MDIKIKTETKKVYITADGREFEDEEVAEMWQRHLELQKKTESVNFHIDDFYKQLDDFKNFVGFFKTP